MASYIFQDLLSRGPASMRNNVADARNWLSDNIKQVQTNRIMADRDRMVDNPSIGRMYMFQYDPKTKDKLPYYDRFPLIFPVGSAPGGFTGLNLHYLPPLGRAKLMDGFWPLVDNENLTERARLNISYDTLKGASRLRYFKPCLKRYLNNHVRSRFVTVYPEEWNVAVFLPTERFAKASKQQVYRDSIGKY